ncbi:MAG: methyltransferase domain-containing protein [Planctomycetota bacterium]|nr:methyltransferase domain-containing protein [Planctomycetota bacterium]
MADKDRARRMFREGGSCRAVGGAGELPTYTAADLAGMPPGAVQAARGCGDPTALAGLREGMAVLDVGCGAGLDAFLAARAVGALGKVIGVDADAGVIEQARALAAQGGFGNVEFRVGAMETLPVDAGSVDVVVSNCAINHAPDKKAAFREAYRVLKDGGRLSVCDLVLKGSLPDPHAPGLEVWADWLDVAMFKHDYLGAVLAAGFKRVIVAAEAAYAGPAMTPALAGRIVGLLVQARR